jgi:hypothetical protein
MTTLLNISLLVQDLEFGEVRTTQKAYVLPLSWKNISKVKKKVLATPCKENLYLPNNKRAMRVTFFLFRLGFGFLPFVWWNFKLFEMKASVCPVN